MTAPAGRVTAVLAGLFVVVLPFEPRGSWRLGPLQLTLLEAFAAVLLVILTFLNRDQLAALRRRPPAPLLAVSAYAAAHLLSAGLAPAHPDLALKAALRMTVMAGTAWVMAAAWPRGRVGASVGLVLAGAAVAALALAEGLGGRSLDPFLALFREMPFNIAGSRRASAGSEYPNLAAAFLMYALLTGVAIAGHRRWRGPLWVAGCGLFAFALLYTYSRGALAATAFGLAAFAVALRRQRKAAGARHPLLALATVALAFGAFAGTTEIQRLRFGSEGIESWYHARYDAAERAFALRPEERRQTEVAVTNTGRKTWVVENGFHLSYHWYRLDTGAVQDGGRTRLPRDLAPGETARLRPEVYAPRTPGDYVLLWDMVHEHSTWFSGQGVRPGSVSVRVTELGEAPPPLAGTPTKPVDLAWRPGRLELWRLAWDMWRERPLVGVGSDNFRWLHGPKAGKVQWDRRVFANNFYVEVAATTGIFGLVALLATLGTSARAAWRTLPGEPRPDGAILFALLAGMAIHGLVDYVFAFTGHYLFLGAVVGACGALGAPPFLPGRERVG